MTTEFSGDFHNLSTFSRHYSITGDAWSGDLAQLTQTIQLTQ